MTHISFEKAWLLLLLIPALALTLIPYFRQPKKYRCTRNKIISMVLHMVIMCLGISVLAGMKLYYNVPYLRNEVILLVDASSSSKQIEEQKDDFVRNIINSSKEEFQLGVVLFGYGEPVYVAELSFDTELHYAKYMNGSVADDSGSDIAAALHYTKNLFSDPNSGKIVLITDGLQTDGDAMSAIMTLAVDGLKVDAAVFSGEFEYNEVQISDVVLPDYSFAEGDTIDVGVVLESSSANSVKIAFFDNDVLSSEKTVTVSKGRETVTFAHVIRNNGLHRLEFIIDPAGSSGDAVEQNNVYHSFLFVESFDKILILERTSGESAMLEYIVSENYQPTVMTINDAPIEVDKLREFDQIILVNIANADMPEGFDVALNSFVRDYGGGMLTVGGNKVENGVETFNTYDKDDMHEKITNRETLYQQMLPVESINYTPPLGLVIVLDRSGSMERTTENGGRSFMELAKAGAADVVKSLSERDHVGIVAFSSSPSEIIKITPVTLKQQILDAITGIQPGGETSYSGAIEMASRALQGLTNVDRRHIIFLTDGIPRESVQSINSIIKDYNDKAGITLSVLSIEADAKGQAICESMAATGQGRYYPITANNATSIPHYMSTDVKMDSITTYNPTTFTPLIKEHTNIVRGIVQSDIPSLDGFYGTRKRSAATETLGTMYSPIYANWKYGRGNVGSFMSDLSGKWSYGFMRDDVGIQLINNIIKSLFPVETVRQQDIQVTLSQDNYTTYASIIAEIEEGQYIEAAGVNTKNGSIAFEKITPVVSEGFARCSFEIKEGGVYRIDVQKLDADGKVISESTNRTYLVFSYSGEYNMFPDTEKAGKMVADMMSASGGTLLAEASEVYNELEYAIEREFENLYLVLIAVALVLLLLDIAVRKFKFKWPHEIVRDYKLKKEMLQSSK